MLELDEGGGGKRTQHGHAYASLQSDTMAKEEEDHGGDTNNKKPSVEKSVVTSILAEWTENVPNLHQATVVMCHDDEISVPWKVAYMSTSFAVVVLQLVVATAVVVGIAMWCRNCSKRLVAKF